MINKFLRKDDFLLSYWMGGNGITTWLVNRRDELFLYTMVLSEMRITFVHWPFNEGAAPAVGRAYDLLGLREFPVYCNWGQCPDEHRSDLKAQFAIYETELAALERQKAEKTEAIDKKKLAVVKK